jgi:hypothetical protein
MRPYKGDVMENLDAFFNSAPDGAGKKPNYPNFLNSEQFILLESRESLLVRNQKFPYRVHKSPIDTIISQFIP